MTTERLDSPSIIPFDLSLFDHITQEQVASVHQLPGFANTDQAFVDLWRRVTQNREHIVGLLVNDPVLFHITRASALRLPHTLATEDDPITPVIAVLSTFFTMGMATGANLVLHYPPKGAQ